MRRNYICYKDLIVSSDFERLSKQSRELGFPLMEVVEVQDRDGWVFLDKVQPKKGLTVELLIDGILPIKRGILIHCDVFNSPILSVLDERGKTSKEYPEGNFANFKWRYHDFSK